MLPGTAVAGAPSLEDHARPRVLIVDDSVVARTVIARAVEGGGRFAVAATVPNAAAALAYLKDERVKAIVLDIDMPGVTGLAALPALIAAGRGAKVLIVSMAAGEGGAATIEALSLGAADTLVKPAAGGFGARFSKAIEDKLVRLLAVEPVATPSPPIAGDQSAGSFDIVAIGASTGGIHALSQLLGEIPSGFVLPILITQHLPASFMPYFAAQVAVLAKRPCDIAADRMRIRPGRVIVAPGTSHLRVVSTGEGAAIRLSQQRVPSGCLPSVDPMLESVAEVYGARALAIVLSGMGRDGADGARRVIERGGGVVAQDEASSVVWGMPGAIVGAGLASAILPPVEMGRMIAARRRPSC